MTAAYYRCGERSYPTVLAMMSLLDLEDMLSLPFTIERKGRYHDG